MHVRRVLAKRRAAIEPLSRRIRALAERAELGQPPEILFGSYLHLHCNRLLGTAQFRAECNGLLRRTRES